MIVIHLGWRHLNSHCATWCGKKVKREFVFSFPPKLKTGEVICPDCFQAFNGNTLGGE